MANENVNKKDKELFESLTWNDRLADLCRRFGKFKTGAEINGVDEGEAKARAIIEEYETWRNLNR